MSQIYKNIIFSAGRDKKDIGRGNMLNIFICDDETGTCEELREILERYASGNKMRYNIKIFYTGTALLEYFMERGRADILFLDISLPGIDGINVGKLIREKIGDEQTIIVYISSNKSYALDLFQNRPFDFIIKPIKEEVIYSLMEKIVRFRGKRAVCLEFQNKGRIYQIPYSDILYLQSEKRKIRVVTVKGIKEYYGKLSEVEITLPSDIFLKIHKSYIVNSYFVEEYAYEQITMVDGSVLNVSQTQRPSVRKKILEHERNRKNGC